MVFVITYRSTLWGLHLDSHVTDGARKSQVVAFEDRSDAERLAHRLWAHRLKTHKWPNTVLEGRPLWLTSAEDVLMMSPSPLGIEEIDLHWLLGRLGRSCCGLSLVFPMHDSDDEDITLKGRYLEATAPSGDQVGWLKKMMERRATKD